jgi:anti-sigma-K factor RskA
VAQPAPTTRQQHAVLEEEPPLDPDAVSRAYRHHRARRAAKAKRHREKRWAGVRFWLVLVLVVVVTAVIAARTLGEIERVFGL